ncbi:hypothetical protein RHMOL_Rhmol01G0222100 [Rhododendron molle]|uniref:Uncharacterized protein n=1 Tax=Rhododendron molle TaxID=49168 RepID=A0ACC0Q7C0_RHOML|nr:hypothetical protein RHMOL_Rhmol01G0222100 [Rhododendron molle]
MGGGGGYAVTNSSEFFDFVGGTYPDAGMATLSPNLQENFRVPLGLPDGVQTCHVEINLADLPSDPGLRPGIMDYNPMTEIKYAEHICKKPDIGHQSGGESTVGEGFSNWKKCDRIRTHVGGPNSAHNQALGKCEVLLNQRQHIQDNQSNKDRTMYRIRLNATVNCIQFLLKQGLPFRGNDESEDSSNQGNFLELLKFLSNHNEEVRGVTFDNAPQNLKLVAPTIQKEIVSAAACETIKVIVIELDDAQFSVLADEAHT